MTDGVDCWHGNDVFPELFRRVQVCTEHGNSAAIRVAFIIIINS